MNEQQQQLGKRTSTKHKATTHCLGKGNEKKSEQESMMANLAMRGADIGARV